jgi:hemolysin-activating ACP:hemolysin acyltransferase
MASAESAKPKALQLKDNMEALGAVLTFLCRSLPYSEFRAAKIIAAIRQQLATRCDVCLIENGRIVAYAGWLPVREQDAESWLKGEVTLKPVPSSSTNAVALTIVSVANRAHVAQIIRACRRLAPQKAIYFKRDYSKGNSRKAKVNAFSAPG